MTNLNNIGIDEVGYGSWAGPLFICALQFTQFPNFDLRDSKKLSEKKRVILYNQLLEISNFQIGIASVSEINTLGLARAYKLALQRAVKDMQGILLIDGSTNRGLEAQCIVKGDEKVPVIAAASIIAKVQRDSLMHDLSPKYGCYNFSQNKGYGTKEHKEAIKRYGFCDQHRIHYKIKLI